MGMIVPVKTFYLHWVAGVNVLLPVPAETE
jgi:hypothetical protein